MAKNNFEQINWAQLSTAELEKQKVRLEEAPYEEVLKVIEEAPNDEKAIIYRLLEKDEAMAVFNMMNTVTQQELFESLSNDVTEEIFTKMSPDDRARLIDEMPAKVTSHYLNTLSEEDREKTNILLGYKEETAGRLMTPDYLGVKKEETVGEVLETVRTVGKTFETVYVIYVMNEYRKLEGVLSLRDLVIADDELKIKEVMNESVEFVTTADDQEDVARKLQDLDLVAIPVVDKEHRLVGIVTIDDAMDVLEEEATEDMLQMSGISTSGNREHTRSDKLINGSIWTVWKVRLPFLMITLIGGLLAGSVIHQFEEALEAVAATAIFIPVIMDMGGNAGAQSSTIFSRGLALGHIRANKFLNHLGKEVVNGATMGAFVGVLTGIVASVWQGIPELGLAVGLAIMLTMTLATTLGFVVPHLLNKMNIDQAAGADPVITTIKDITGLIIYFVLVTQFLGALL